MQVTSYLPCLWPGLPQLWWRGSWRALLTAISFAALLNLTLICTFIWPNYLSPWVTGSAWIVIIVFWGLSVWQACRHVSKLAGAADATAVDRWFGNAQREYLHRNWFEAETLLKRILREKRDDVDARLMLATLYRRTDRLAEADACLRRLEQMEGAEKWALEIGRERNLIADQGSKTEAA